MSQFDCFLKIDGIEGESKDSQHKDEIEVESYSVGATQTGSFAYGGGGANKVQFQDFHFTMKADKASAKLFHACAKGDHIAKAVLTCRKAGGKQQEFLKYTMSDLLVSSFQVTGRSAASLVPEIAFSLNFTKLEEGVQGAEG